MAKMNVSIKVKNIDFDDVTVIDKIINKLREKLVERFEQKSTRVEEIVHIPDDSLEISAGDKRTYEEVTHTPDTSINIINIEKDFEKIEKIVNYSDFETERINYEWNELINSEDDDDEKFCRMLDDTSEEIPKKKKKNKKKIIMKYVANIIDKIEDNNSDYIGNSFIYRDDDEYVVYDTTYMSDEEIDLLSEIYTDDYTNIDLGYCVLNKEDVIYHLALNHKREIKKLLKSEE